MDRKEITAGAAETEHSQNQPSSQDNGKEQAMEKKGIWEATYESGAIIGYYEGTPRQIAAFIVNTVDEGTSIRKLIFMRVPVRKIPDRLMRTLCCERNYSKNDNFCSRCGKSLKISDKLPAKLKISINE